tara:strand:- start:955 stop:1062 length:108 start_codon:yes stop_codon:yes gene_type:complete
MFYIVIIKKEILKVKYKVYIILRVYLVYIDYNISK